MGTGQQHGNTRKRLRMTSSILQAAFEVGRPAARAGRAADADGGHRRPAGVDVHRSERPLQMRGHPRIVSPRRLAHGPGGPGPALGGQRGGHGRAVPRANDRPLTRAAPDDGGRPRRRARSSTSATSSCSRRSTRPGWPTLLACGRQRLRHRRRRCVRGLRDHVRRGLGVRRGELRLVRRALRRLLLPRPRGHPRGLPPARPRLRGVRRAGVAPAAGRVFALEVNLDPPNDAVPRLPPGSGYREVGQRDSERAPRRPDGQAAP